MKKVQFDQIQIPEFMLPYFVNSDSSGMELEDIQSAREIESFIAEAYKGGSYSINPKYDAYGNLEKYFTYNPDHLSLACDVVDCDLIVYKD